MNNLPQQQRDRAESLLLHNLQKSTLPLNLQELAAKLNLEAAIPRRAVTEAAWKLVEEGKAQFTPAWELAARR